MPATVVGGCPGGNATGGGAGGVGAAPVIRRLPAACSVQVGLGSSHLARSRLCRLPAEVMSVAVRGDLRYGLCPTGTSRNCWPSAASLLITETEHSRQPARP